MTLTSLGRPKARYHPTSSPAAATSWTAHGEGPGACRAPYGSVYLRSEAARSGSGSGRMHLRPVVCRALTVPGSLSTLVTACVFPSQPCRRLPLYKARRRRIYSKLAAGHGLVNTPLQILSNPVCASSADDLDHLRSSMRLGRRAHRTVPSICGACQSEKPAILMLQAHASRTEERRTLQQPNDMRLETEIR